MDFFVAIARVNRALHQASVHFALIGGMAMAARGVVRATFDLDFLLMLEDLPAADAALRAEGYQCVFKSDNVSHYENPNLALTRIDILHAFRGPSLGMLKRAAPLAINPDITLPVVSIEDLIGLKVQALTNNPTRARSDWSDIHLLIAHLARSQQPPDWNLIQEYLEIFNCTAHLAELTRTYHETQPH
jgi:Uncharacterised nucleotidyltransferase